MTGHIKLSKNLEASTNREVLKEADVIFLAIPSSTVEEFVLQNRGLISSNAIIVNLAKGFSVKEKTIVESLQDIIVNSICSLKGPTFAMELINNLPSAFTLASEDVSLFKEFSYIVKDTNVYFDFSTDIRGVELISILKNVYAILLGIIDAHFNSANVRFLILTKGFSEMKRIIERFGGNAETLFKYCGYGDFGLTALNDLSRNRTLGLLIGKGFLNNNVSNNVILEGIRALDIFYREISRTPHFNKDYYLISALYKLLKGKYDVHSFIKDVLTGIHNDSSIPPPEYT